MKSGPKWVNYIVFTFIVNIVCLNLLIAILSNVFDNVQSSIEVFHIKSKIEILLDTSHIMIWNKENVKKTYLFFIRYANEKQVTSDKVDEWVGRVRVMTDKIQVVQDYCKVNQVQLSNVE